MSHALEPQAKRLLRTLYELAQHDCPATKEVLARLLGLPTRQVTDELARLGRLGLVDATCVRLTLRGLVSAVRVPARAVQFELPVRAPLRLAKRRDERDQKGVRFCAAVL